MTAQSKSLISRVIKEGTREVRKGDTIVFVEGDLAKVCPEDKSFIVPVVSIGNYDNIGIFVRAHGDKDGSLWMWNDYVTPREIREAVAAYWSKDTPILMTCCHPKSVQRRYGKELKRNHIELMYPDEDDLVWASDTPGTCVSVYTNEAHEDVLRRRAM